MSNHRSSLTGHPASDVPRAPGLYVKVKYNNTLPDIPFDPKFIVNPLSLSRFVDYETTSLEHNLKHELIMPKDLGVDIDLILPEKYAIPTHPLHEPEDDKLLNDDEPILQSAKKSQRDKPHSQLHNKVVPWLKKTEYISTEYNRYGASTEKTETKVGYNVRKKMKDEQVFLDKDHQIKAINETFSAAQRPIEKHPTKAGVTAKRVMPLIPDIDSWKYLFAHVKFDTEPADATKVDQMSQAIVRGAYDEELQESFVVYFLPTEVTMADRLIEKHNGIEYTEGKEYEYKSSREYTWSAKQVNDADDFFFVVRDDKVYYNKLSMEVTLKKRRNKSRNGSASTLVVRMRETNAEEIENQEEKLRQLMKPQREYQAENTLTAESLEQSYEEQQQEETATNGNGDALPMESQKISSPQSSAGSSSSSSSSSPPTSDVSSSSSSEDEEEKEEEEEEESEEDS